MQQRRIAMIGLGYVGLPAAVAFAQYAPVIGFDHNPERIQALQQGIDLTGEVDRKDLQQADINFSHQPASLQQADFYIIAVPTPVDANKQPDLTPVLSATKTLAQHLKKGDIVVYESTVYPGATEERCIPVLERYSGLHCGKDFSIAYSPERINPGDKVHRFDKVVKVVSAYDEQTLDIVAAVYEQVISAGVHRAPSIKVAEAAKVVENTQRDVNIALMNELAMIFDRLGIDSHDVLAAAGTKWNFLPFTPGLVGGHCIGVDPYYLVDKAKQVGYNASLIPAGRQINESIGAFIARRTIEQLITAGCLLHESTITILGLAFKEDVPDLRNTRVVDIIQALQAQGLKIQVHDPLVDKQEALDHHGITLCDNPKPAQAVILAVAHRSYLEQGWAGIEKLLDKPSVVIDIKGVLDRKAVPTDVSLWRF